MSRTIRKINLKSLSSLITSKNRTNNNRIINYHNIRSSISTTNCYNNVQSIYHGLYYHRNYVTASSTILNNETNHINHQNRLILTQRPKQLIPHPRYHYHHQHYYQQQLQHQQIVCFGTESSHKNDNNNKKLEKEDKKIVNTDDDKEEDDEVSILGKGISQVIFVNSAIGGTMIIGSLAIGDPFLAIMALTGTATSQYTAKVSLLSSSTSSSSSSKNDTTTTNNNNYINGLLSYNGCLMGCASAVFLPTIPSAVIGTIIGASASTYTTLMLSQILTNNKNTSMPQWTYAFNICMLTILLNIQPLKSSSTTIASVATDLSTSATASAAAAEVVVTSSPSLWEVCLLGPLNGISQIFVVESWMTGLGILIGTASTYSPALAGYALAGSTMGTITGGIVFHAPYTELISGLWGYNPALTAMGIGVFFNATTQSKYALLISSSATTAAVFGACKYIFGDILSTPCLTLPFCLTMSATWYLGLSNTITGISLTKNPHSPERNKIKE